MCPWIIQIFLPNRNAVIRFCIHHGQVGSFNKLFPDDIFSLTSKQYGLQNVPGLLYAKLQFLWIHQNVLIGERNRVWRLWETKSDFYSFPSSPFSHYLKNLLTNSCCFLFFCQSVFMKSLIITGILLARTRVSAFHRTPRNFISWFLKSFEVLRLLQSYCGNHFASLMSTCRETVKGHLFLQHFLVGGMCWCIGDRLVMCFISKAGLYLFMQDMIKNALCFAGFALKHSLWAYRMVRSGDGIRMLFFDYSVTTRRNRLYSNALCEIQYSERPTEGWAPSEIATETRKVWTRFIVRGQSSVLFVQKRPKDMFRNKYETAFMVSSSLSTDSFNCLLLFVMTIEDNKRCVDKVWTVVWKARQNRIALV